MKRAIVLFPKFSNSETIQAVRERFDPLANYIAPHITLVFPFESAFSTEKLKAHLRHTLAGMKQFTVNLNGVTGDFRDGYLFLNVKQGNDSIIDLHDRLYSGELEPFLLRKVTYCPHITVGRVEESSAFDRAIVELAGFQERFEAEIDKVYVENIDSGDRSTIELIFELE